MSFFDFFLVKKVKKPLGPLVYSITSFSLMPAEAN